MHNIPDGPAQYIGDFLSARDICHLEQASQPTKGWVDARKLWECFARARTGLSTFPIGCTSWKAVVKRSAIHDRNLEHLHFKVTLLDKRLSQKVIPLELKIGGKPYLACVLSKRKSVEIWNPLSGESYSTLSLPNRIWKIARIHLLGSFADPQGILAQYHIRDVQGLKRKPWPLLGYAWDTAGQPLQGLMDALSSTAITCFHPLPSTKQHPAILATISNDALYLWDCKGNQQKIWEHEGLAGLAARLMSDGKCVLATHSQTRFKSWAVKACAESWVKERKENKWGQQMLLLARKESILYCQQCLIPTPAWGVLERPFSKEDLIVISSHLADLHGVKWTKVKESIGKNARYLDMRPERAWGSSPIRAQYLGHPRMTDWVEIGSSTGKRWLVRHCHDGLAFLDGAQVEAMAKDEVKVVSRQPDSRFACKAIPWLTSARLDGLVLYLLLNTDEGVKMLSFAEEEALEEGAQAKMRDRPSSAPRIQKRVVYGAVALVLLGSALCRIGYKRLFKPYR